MPGPSSLQPAAAPAARQVPHARAAALRDAARQLEGVFVGMMFEEMAKGLGKDGGLMPKSPGSDMYQQWFRTEVANQFARSGGLGLGDAIAQRLDGSAAPESSLPADLARPPVPDGILERATHREAVPARPPPVARRPSPPPTLGKAPPPVPGRLTSPFGARVHPVTGQTGVHEGVDLAAPEGTPVRLPYGGRVARVGEDPLLGKHVVVTHRGGYRSIYAHLSEISVRVGQRVESRAMVGRSGATGRVTGPHLHFALYRRGEPVDPSRWVDIPTP